MQTTDEADGTLVVSHDSTAWFKWMAVGAVALLAVAAHDLFTESGRGDRVRGCLGAAATLVAIGLAAAESGRFAFDGRRKVVEWRRRFAWWRREGTLAFDEIADVAIETPIGDEGVPSRRIVLRLASGRVLPLRASYRPDRGDALLRIAERIRATLGKPAPSQQQRPQNDAIAALIVAGRKIEAIKELRRTRGLSLVEAKREVDAATAEMR
jgi:hypothetical protein